MNGSYRPGDVVLGNWTLGRKIGEGSFGQVFEATREDFGVTYRAAIKIITIPQSESEIKSARSEGLDDGSITSYFRSFVEEIVQEFVLMSKLKGNSNIVSYEDHTVLEHQDHIGWDIIIRMELLTPLLDYIQKCPLSRQDVVKLGIDITRALELCQKHNIVHRDIKPENIFVSEAGDYKLGDFGIARTVEKTTGGLSKKGTYTYMAPEVYKDEPYGPSVDIYSLGLVMYRLLNENRAPFLPPYPAPITHSDRENAMVQRISGARIPAPKDADERLAQIVLKACAYQPRERWSGPAQMRSELEAILHGSPQAAGYADDRTVGGFAPQAPAPVQPSLNGESTERTSSVFGGQAPVAGGSYQPSPYPQAEPTASDRTQSVFGSAAPANAATPPSAAPDFTTKPQKRKKPLGKLLVGIGVPVLVFAVVFFISKGMSGPRPLDNDTYSLTEYEPLHSFPEVSAPPLDEILTTPEPFSPATPRPLERSEPESSLATIPPAPADMKLILPELMMTGTRATPILTASTAFAAGADGSTILVTSSDESVVRVDTANECICAEGPGAANITVSYSDKIFTQTITVLDEDPDSYGYVGAELQDDGGMDSTYRLEYRDLPNIAWQIRSYVRTDGPVSVEFGDNQGDGPQSLSVSLFEGTAEVTLIIVPKDDPSRVIASTTINVDSGF